MHFLMACKKLEATREATIKVKLGESPETSDMSNVEKVRWLLNRAHIKTMGEHVHTLFQARQNLI